MTSATEAWALSVIDVSGIQGYIFGSNRLRDNIGASHLVGRVTTDWLEAALPQPHNFDGARIGSATLDSDPTLQAEVVYSGGGNMVLLVRGRNEDAALATAKQIVAQLSRTLLACAPGLEIVVAHRVFDPANDSIGGQGGVYDQLFRQLDAAKRRAPASNPLGGLGVTRQCASTGLPAVERFDYAPRTRDDRPDIQPLSAPARARVDFATIQDSERAMRETLAIPEEWRIPRDLDELGRSRGEESYIAVVHADGNGLGQRFLEVLKPFTTADDNRACLDALRALSRAVEQAGSDAFKSTVQAMIATLNGANPTRDDPLGRLIHELRPGRGETPLPLRPLIFGGDDVTFVCDGRLGLGMAARYLSEFEQAAAALPGGPAHACAGVAVVKSHYPFARAYQLSVELCAGAKAQARVHGDQPVLDWQFATTGISGSLEVLRKRGYLAQPGDLTMRPVTLDEPLNGFGWRHWKNVTALIAAFSDERSWPTSKLAALREGLRNGPNAVKEWRTRFWQNMELPELAHVSDTGARRSLVETGWAGGRCGYFDAIEALDFFIELT